MEAKNPKIKAGRIFSIEFTKPSIPVNKKFMADAGAFHGLTHPAGNQESADDLLKDNFRFFTTKGGREISSGTFWMIL